MNLLDEIKKQPNATTRRNDLNPQDNIPTALAWVKNEITITQLGRVLKKVAGKGSTSYVYTILAISLKEYLKDKLN